MADTPTRRLPDEWLQRLLDVSLELNAEARPGAVLERIVDNLIAITNADRGVLLVKDEDGHLAYRLARDREGRPIPEENVRLCLGLVEDVVQDGTTRLVEDAEANERWRRRATVVELELRTLLSVPLTTAKGVIGAIYVDSHRAAHRFTEEHVPLVEAFAALAASAVERVRLQQAAQDRDRMRRQLRFAAELQKTFLLNRFPEVEGVRGAIASVPALEVGGDFYDVIRMPGGRVALLVGDVAGKGIGGALFGARFLADVRYEALYRDDVASTLVALNRLVADHATRGMFITFLLAVVDPKTRRVHYGNAGHPPPLVRHADGRVESWDEPSGIPLGIETDVVYEAGVRRLEPGQTLVLLTDGLADAVRPDGERFGARRVDEAIRAAAPAPQAVVDTLLASTAWFAGRRRQVDDQTLLAIALT